MKFGDRLQHAFNALKGDPYTRYINSGLGSSRRPDRTPKSTSNEKSIVGSIYNRIAIDVASVNIRHIRIDENDSYVDDIDSRLNDCLKHQANLDQTGRELIQDIVESLCDEGVVAVVPVDTTKNPRVTKAFDITSLRVAKILQWYPKQIQVRVYNEETGLYVDTYVDKEWTAIITNPLYSIMNQSNSTLKRLVSKINLLDAIDNQSGSGKLDLIMRLPFAIRGEKKKQEAAERLQALEDQLTGSKYGIGYIDATENVTQLNRPVNNNLMGQVEYLTRMLYSQLGIDESVLDGTANEQTMLNYYNRTVDPMLKAITEALTVKFLTVTARTQRQTIRYFRDPFALVPVEKLADIADKFTRNAILSSNEFRSIVKFKPSDDPRANELSNKNINQNSESPEYYDEGDEYIED